MIATASIAIITDLFGLILNPYAQPGGNMLLEKKPVRQRVLDILLMAMTDHLVLKRGVIFYAGQQIFVKNGFVSQSVFANPNITGSTEGKRRLRELRADPELQKKYRFEMKNEGNRWSYRILPRGTNIHNRLLFHQSEVMS
jgi:hypothetical protein